VHRLVAGDLTVLRFDGDDPDIAVTEGHGGVNFEERSPEVEPLIEDFHSGLELSGSGTLSQSLVSHGVAFAAGSPFKSSTQLNVGNLGAGWKFDFDAGRLELFPKIDVAICKLSLSSPIDRARYQRHGSRHRPFERVPLLSKEACSYDLSTNRELRNDRRHAYRGASRDRRLNRLALCAGL